MSNLGMERHEHPDFEYQDLNDADGPSFWWKNPYNGRREKIANLWWPEHPVEATEAIEALFENLKLTYEPYPPGTEPPQSINTELLEAAKALGAMPEGYCFCSNDRIGDDSKIHEPECRDLRTAVARAETV